LLQYQPGDVPMREPLSLHVGILGSKVWKKTQRQIANRAARTP